MTDRLADRPLEQPHPRRLAPGHPRYGEILAAHADALARREPCYIDPVSRRSVFTAAFLAERGWCCTSGCRHCPYVV